MEAEAQCAAMIREAETCCVATIKEADTHHATQAYTLEKFHKESMFKLEHAVLVEEGHDCQAFVEACGTALWACPLKPHGVLMYPLQLLTGNVPLATTPQLATAGREPPPTASPSMVSRMPASPTGTNGGADHLTRKQ